MHILIFIIKNALCQYKYGKLLQFGGFIDEKGIYPNLESFAFEDVHFVFQKYTLLI